MRRLLILVPVLTALHLQSCFVATESINEPLMANQVRALKPGSTTARQVVEQLGAPSDVIQLGKNSAYRYDHTIGKRAGLWLVLVGLFNEDLRQDRAWLFFDENQTLTHVGSTFSSHRAQHSMPWEDIHEKSDNDSRDADRRDLQK